MGALKAAANPPAAPAATSVRTPSSLRRPRWAMTEPREAPIWIIGPSRPALPPDPSVREEARAFTTATLPRIRPPRMRSACTTSGTPCPEASRARNQTRGPTKRPPTHGMRMMRQRGAPATDPRMSPLEPQNTDCAREMSSFTAMAPSPATTPTMAASRRIRRCCSLTRPRTRPPARSRLRRARIKSFRKRLPLVTVPLFSSSGVLKFRGSIVDRTHPSVYRAD